MQKYELTGESIKLAGNERVLYRIRALIDIGEVGKGTLGGFVESEVNLSDKGTCWIADDAKVFSNATVSGDAVVSGKALVGSEARVTGNASVRDSAFIAGSAVVSDFAVVKDSAVLIGHTNIKGHAVICDNANISNEAVIDGEATIGGSADVAGSSHVCGNTIVDGEAKVGGSAVVSGSAHISDTARVTDDALISGNAVVSGYSLIADFAKVDGDTRIMDGAKVIDNAVVTGEAVLKDKACAMNNSFVQDATLMGCSFVKDNASIKGKRCEIETGVIIGGDTVIDSRHLLIVDSGITLIGGRWSKPPLIYMGSQGYLCTSSLETVRFKDRDYRFDEFRDVILGKPETIFGAKNARKSAKEYLGYLNFIMKYIAAISADQAPAPKWRQVVNRLKFK